MNPKVPAIILILGALSLLLLCINWQFPVIRLVSPIANDLFFLLSIPLILLSQLVMCLFMKRRTLQISGGLFFAVLLSLYSCVILLSLIAGGPFTSFELMDSAQMQKTRVTAYRVNAGTTTDYSVVVRQEMSIFPGLLLVKNLHSGYREYDAKLNQALEDNTITLIIDTTNGPTQEKHQLKKFIYF